MNVVDPSRWQTLLAKIRGRQLETALRGRLIESYRHAQRAHRLRRLAAPSKKSV